MATTGMSATGTGACATLAGNCTLTAAIQESNALAGPDEINFSIDLITDRYGQGITDVVTIDGSGPGRATLEFASSSLSFRDKTGNVVRGLAIYGSISTILDATVIVENNFLATDGFVNTSFNGNISLSTDGNVVGGTAPSARNVVDGRIEPRSSENKVIGNYIGITADGTAGLGDAGNAAINVREGVTGRADNNVIGMPGAGNVVSSSGGIGIRGISRGTLIQSNYVGTDATGQIRIGNSRFGAGIAITSPSNTVGGTERGMANVVSRQQSHRNQPWRG